jgi:hypothetical protein
MEAMEERNASEVWLTEVEVLLLKRMMGEVGLNNTVDLYL